MSQVGAMRLSGSLRLATLLGAISTPRFVTWVRRRLVPRLRPGDIVVTDNLAAHKTGTVRELIEGAGAAVQFLPPYSHDFNPIESGRALLKKRIRTVAPRTADHLRCTVRRARRVVPPPHCCAWSADAGHQLE